MKRFFLYFMLLLAGKLYSQDTAIFIRAGFFVASGEFTQSINGKIIMADASGATVEIDNPQFSYKGTTTGATALFGVKLKSLYIMAGVRNIVLTPDAVETNFTIDNLTLPDPINYGLGLLRIEYDLIPGNFYLSPMGSANYVFSFEGSNDFFEDGKREFSYSYGITLGAEVKRFKFFLTPFMSRIPIGSDLLNNDYKDSGGELSVHVSLFD